MSEMTSPGSSTLTREQEERAFYHEAGLNRSWTGVRLAVGVITAGLGAFGFAFFYLKALNSYGNWYPPGFQGPALWQGLVIYGGVVLSAVLQTAGLMRIKAGQKAAWSNLAVVALVIGLVAVAFQIWQLTALPFQPGGSGYASVFVGFSPIFAVLVLGTMIWLEVLVMRGRQIPAISFTEQPPTFTEAASLQEFQAGLSALTFFLNFMAIAAIVFWVLFYLVH